MPGKKKHKFDKWKVYAVDGSYEHKVDLDELQAEREEFVRRFSHIAREFIGDRDVMDRVFPGIEEDKSEKKQAIFHNYLATLLLAALSKDQSDQTWTKDSSNKEDK